MHTVAVLAMNGLVALDTAIPCDLFGKVRLPDPDKEYNVRVCGETPEVRAGVYNIRAPWTLADLVNAATVIVPGIDHPELPIPDPIIDAVQAAAANGARIASICTGAFVLAAAGLLSGMRATTHWNAADMLAKRYPDIHVDPSVLYVDNGQILTSAGASSGLDLCLHLIRRDHGQAVAATIARLAVAPLDREGGQAQFIHYEAPCSSSNLASLLAWMDENAYQPLSIAILARRAAMSTRTFIRRFKEQTGTTPLQWILSTRVRHAQELLEMSQLSIDEIAIKTGFSDPANFRARFRRVLGVSPYAYRRTFSSINGVSQTRRDFGQNIRGRI
jgi:transcriptional regulator GlxA family with amidase domain